MNIRDLKYLVAVYDLKNFSKAAQRCFVSQPTLSGQLKKLEEQLGAPLMERTTRQVLFTQLGEQVVIKAREVLLIIENIKDLAQNNEDEMAGEFHIGLIPTVGPFLLPLIMPELSKQFPQMKVFLYELQTKVLLEKLHNGELGAIILAKLDWDFPVTEIHLYHEPMLLAVSEQHAFAQNTQPAELKMLKNQSVLMLEDGHCLRDQALGVCFAAGADEDHSYQATSIDTLLHMVGAGAGITLVPKLATKEKKQGIKYLPFAEPQPSREIVMLTRKNSVRLAAFAKVTDLIANVNDR